ncbi:hypothetical protein [Sporohalobacter salinus]|uniref:hypothetical protein n=1 Tax=Sporohalobacter salinus TaxID=1494606 RepID=UPI0019600D86|nr:hypothetical protein [Sporohalobacter salinus]MBM7622995.1 hypothetical protein [Sporohalobacter salinus]
MIDFIEADYRHGYFQKIKSGQLSCQNLTKLLTSIISKTEVNRVGLIERINLQDNCVRYIIKDYQGQVLAVKDYHLSTT